jgi:O-antigen ligase
LRNYVHTAEFISVTGARRAGRFASVVAKTIFVSLMVLIAFTAIPYGTVEPWWKAFFVCAVLALTMLQLIESIVTGSWIIRGGALLLPLISLTVLAFIQTLSIGSQATPGIPQPQWNAISADPYGTRFFALQLLALTLAAALLFRHVSNERRLRALINVIIGVAVASALFGIIRQTSQHTTGFVLPLIQQGQGYGQFVNQNHFAYLMEMGFGLVLGLIFAGGVRRERVSIYFACLLPIWTALVLSNSRGGQLAVVAQVIAGVLLFPLAVPVRNLRGHSHALRIVRLLPVRMFLLALLLIGLIFGTLWIGGDRLVSRFEPGSTERDPSAASRKEIWQATWQMSKAHPIAGVGLGGYWIAIPGYHNASGTLVPQEAHNDYLELLASGGIIGIALGIWFAVVVFKRVRRNFQSSNRFHRAASFGATLGIAGVAVHSLFDFGLHIIVNALIFVALIVIATTESPEPVYRQ